MKVLIWVGCVFVTVIFVTAIGGWGNLGGIGACLVIATMIGVATGLSKAWDKHKSTKKYNSTKYSKKEFISQTHITHPTSSNNERNNSEQTVENQTDEMRVDMLESVKNNDIIKHSYFNEECVFCGERIKDMEGSNPWPVIVDSYSVCCASCNASIVKPARNQMHSSDANQAIRNPTLTNALEISCNNKAELITVDDLEN